jgi:hypothetical protein
VNDAEKREHAQQLYETFCTATDNLARGMLALGERMEQSHKLKVIELDEMRASREQAAALQRQVGVLVEVISRAQGIPVQPISMPMQHPNAHMQNMVNGALRGLFGGGA